MKFLILLLFFSYSLSFAGVNLFPINWKNLAPEEKAFLIAEIQKTMGSLAPQKAQEDCSAAGWVGLRKRGEDCLPQIKGHAFYKRYLGCPTGQILCNPSLFGEQICLKDAARENLFGLCQKEFYDSSRDFLSLADHVRDDEFSALVSWVEERCTDKELNASPCLDLKKTMDSFFPNETPHSLKQAQEDFKKTNVEKMLQSAKMLQKEMEQDLLDFSKSCEDGITSSEEMLCKNLALRVKSANDFLPKIHAKLGSLSSDKDCVHCSSPQTQVSIENKLLQEVSCEKDESDCDKAVMCTILSGLTNGVNYIREGILGQKPSGCISSQNDCVTNVATTLAKSLLDMVTLLWDVAVGSVEWTARKLGNFWDDIVGIEDKTSDAQQLLNNMSTEDVNSFKANPLQWIKNFGVMFWEGTKLWVKEDIFCEKWSGVPRMSTCLVPARGWSCMNCQAKINGICSSAGVVLSFFATEFFAGFTMSSVAKGASEARAFATAIKSSKNYKKIVAAVDKLAEVKAVQVGMSLAKVPVKAIGQGVVKPISALTRQSINQISAGHKALVLSKAYQETAKIMGVAAKYSGLRALSALNSRIYQSGYQFADHLLGKGSAPVMSSSLSARLAQNLADEEEVLKVSIGKVTPLLDDVSKAHQKGSVMNELKNQYKELSKVKDPSEAVTNRMKAIDSQYNQLSEELNAINNKYLKRMHELYVDEGIPSRLVPDSNGTLTLELDFSHAPTSKNAFLFFQRVKERFGLAKITVSLRDNAILSSNGYFLSSAKQVDLGPNQALSLLSDYVNSTAKHESRHAMFFAKANAGEDSVYHVIFSTKNSSKLLGVDTGYGRFMSAEEVYTFSTDLQNLAQVLKGENIADVGLQKRLLEQVIRSNNQLLATSEIGRSVATDMITSLDELLKGPSKANGIHLQGLENGNWSLKIHDEFQREAEIILVTEKEKLIAKKFMETNTKMKALVKKDVMKTLKESGIDSEAFLKNEEAGKLSVAEKIMLDSITDSAKKKSDYVLLAKQLEQDAIPLLQNAHENMSAISKISAIQYAEAMKVKSMINQLGNGQSFVGPDQLDPLRQQLFSMSKNVKEGYKGSPLYKPISP